MYRTPVSMPQVPTARVKKDERREILVYELKKLVSVFT
jgi:hypothetical protein